MINISIWSKCFLQQRDRVFQCSCLRVRKGRMNKQIVWSRLSFVCPSIRVRIARYSSSLSVQRQWLNLIVATRTRVTVKRRIIRRVDLIVLFIEHSISFETMPFFELNFLWMFHRTDGDDEWLPNPIDEWRWRDHSKGYLSVIFTRWLTLDRCFPGRSERCYCSIDSCIICLDKISQIYNQRERTVRWFDQPHVSLTWSLYERISPLGLNDYWILGLPA